MNIVVYIFCNHINDISDFNKFNVLFVLTDFKVDVKILGKFTVHIIYQFK